MKRNLEDLLREGRASYAPPAGNVPEMPPGFSGRVARLASESDRARTKREAVWTRTCLAGACAAVTAVFLVQMETSKREREIVADAWLAVGALERQ